MVIGTSLFQKEIFSGVEEISILFYLNRRMLLVGGLFCLYFIAGFFSACCSLQVFCKPWRSEKKEKSEEILR